jgi:hypothetical protein
VATAAEGREIPVKEYMPPSLSEEEAVQLAIKSSELIELA